MASNRIIAGLMAAIGLMALLFSVLPDLDIAVSGLFYDRGLGFPLDDNTGFDALRRTIWGASIALFATALIGSALPLFRLKIATIPTRLWGFVLLLYALGPGVLVEWGLKGHWGRARPVQVAEFGGKAQFTPFWDATDQCVQNCSFVGGESAGATVLAICLLLILSHLRPRLPLMLLRLGQTLALLMPLVAGFHRIATGRHFLSDVVFSVLFILVLAAILVRIWPPLPRLAGRSA